MFNARLKGIFLTLTNKCNLNCKYCYQKQYSQKDKLSGEDWFKIIDEAKNLKAKKICFVGGEPILYNEFWKVLDYAYLNDFKIKIFTNGVILDGSIVKKLAKYPVVLSFNLNSHNEKIHDFYQEEGNWRKVVNALSLCKGKIDFEISSPITKKNYSSIEHFFNFCFRLGAKRLRLIPLILTKKVPELRNDKLSKEQIFELEGIIEKFKRKNDKFEITLGCKKCEAGKHYLTIQSDGNITPCTLNFLVLGNIMENSLKSILYTTKDRLFSHCV